MILICGALLGFISVAFGAFAEHGLREIIPSDNFRFLMTAVRYNQVHAVLIVTIGLLLLNGKTLANIAIFKLSAMLFVIGIVLFSFSIYISVSFNIPEFLKITPIGGMTIMAGWLMLLVSGVIAIVKKL